MIGGGDTPEETLYFKRKDQIGNTYLIAKYGTNSKNLLLGAVSSGAMYIVMDQGKIVSNQGPTVEQFAPNYKQIAEAAGYEVNSTGIWLPEFEVGGEIENWDSYINV